MTTALIAFAVLWVACGVVQYGWALAFYQQRWPTVRSKSDVVVAGGVALLGLPGLVGAVIGASPWGRLWAYGFQWRPMPSAKS